MSFIQLLDITKVYKMGNLEVRALFALDLNINQGEFLAIMGHSGSGKSTLMDILGCLDRPTSGSYKFEGKEVANKDQKELAYIRREKIGFIFQSFYLLPKTSALYNVALPMIYKRIHHKKRKELALMALTKVGLKDRALHRPDELSGGERQKVAIARALINSPSLILADEPTGNLDSNSGEAIMQILIDLNKEGVTIVLVTHNYELANYTDRKIFLQDGEIIN